MSNNKTAVHIRPWQVSAQVHIQNIQMAATCVQQAYFLTNLKYANKLPKHMSHGEFAHVCHACYHVATAKSGN